MTDEQYMNRAIKLAMKGTGFVSPNPKVGAVIVRDDKIIGEGWHKSFGGPHAEIEAINSAGDVDLKGAVMYVTLEPCSHQGKTPPCAPRLVELGFSRVVIGMSDPNPQVDGKGIEILRNAGIEVKTGVLESECRWLNRFFVKNISTGMPYVILKSAQSLNGAIATFNGDSKWITGEESLRRAHVLRSHVDAVLVGKQTVLLDNPQLTVRNVKGRNPKRIVLDTNLTIPKQFNVFSDENRLDTIVCCTPDASSSPQAKEIYKLGVNFLPVPKDKNGKLNLKEVLKSLVKEYNITSILVEGGAAVLSAFAKESLADEYHFFMAPMIIGGGLNAYWGYDTDLIKNAQKLEIKSITLSGEDIHVIAINKFEK